MKHIRETNVTVKDEYSDESQLWALCYLVDWFDNGIWPDIHRVYDTWEEAEAVRKQMTNPEKYWVRRAHRGKATITRDL